MTEALIITGLGVAVVFLGLILTSLLISSFAFFPRLLQRLRRQTQAPPPSTVPSGSDAAPPEPEVLAVIATLLEIEYRLRLPLLEGRFTFRP